MAFTQAKRREKKAGKMPGTSKAVVEEADARADSDDLYEDEGLPDDLASDPFFAEAEAEREMEEEEARRSGQRAVHKREKAKAGAREGAEASAPTSAREGADGKKKGKKKGKKAREAAMSEEEAAKAARKEAELELLMLGDDDGEARQARRGYNLKELELTKGQAAKLLDGRGSKRKRAAAAAAAAAAAGADGFSLDVQDDRFSSIYNSSDFAIDPTHPKYRHTSGSEQLMREIHRRHSETEGRTSTSTASRDGARDGEPSPRHRPDEPHTGDDHERAGARADESRPAAPTGEGRGGLWSLVSSVKMKAKQAAGKAAGKAAKGKGDGVRLKQQR